jgi:uncharacterized protein YkwD
MIGQLFACLSNSYIVISMHKLKSWLWPHKTNHFHPHLLRPIGLGLAIAVLLGANGIYNYSSAKSFQVLGYATSIDASEIIGLSNQQRTSRGLAALGTNSKLNQAAAAKAQDMVNRNYWAHYAPDGTSPWYFITNAGYNYATAGENLAKDFNTSGGVVNAWMNSPAHRDNILNTGYTETGIAVLNGTLQGQQTTLVVAMYASPKVAAAPAPAQTTPVAPKAQPKATTPTSQAPVVQPAQTQPEAPAQQPAAPAVEATPKAIPTQTTTVVSDKADLKGVTLAAETEKAVAARQQMNWARSVSLFVLSVLLLVTILKHTLVWRTQKRGWRHIWMRAHPAAQYALLLLAIVLNLTSSVGVIK